jgi:hypothetical protein
MPTISDTSGGLQPAPDFLDLAWRAGRIPGVYVACRTPLAEAAFIRARRGLEGAGLRLRDRLVEWDTALAPAEPKLSRLLAGWARTAGDELALQESRAAARRPVDAGELASMQARLRDTLATSAWAFRSKVGIAEDFAGAPSLTPAQHRFAGLLLAEALDVVRAVEARLRTPAGQEDLAAVGDPDVRADLLAACRFLTGLDEDMCQERNGRGWSAVASASGHRLAAMDELDVLQAAHARRLVHAHRSQLPSEMRARLFGVS